MCLDDQLELKKEDTVIQETTLLSRQTSEGNYVIINVTKCVIITLLCLIYPCIRSFLLSKNLFMQVKIQRMKR